MVTAAWHLWQWQIDWPQRNIWDDTGRACVHRHTIKTSGHEGTLTESQLHLQEVKNFMEKHDWGWKGEPHWQGVHLQLAYCGMLIRPAKTRHLPPKCHILVRRAGNGDRFRWLPSGIGCRGLFAFPVAISFLFSLLQAFSLYILLLLLSALLLCCLLCDEWLHFKLRFFFFLLAGIQSVQLCGNKIDLAKTHCGGDSRGRKIQTATELHVNLHFQTHFFDEGF